MTLQNQHHHHHAPSPASHRPHATSEVGRTYVPWEETSGNFGRSATMIGRATAVIPRRTCPCPPLPRCNPHKTRKITMKNGTRPRRIYPASNKHHPKKLSKRRSTRKVSNVNLNAIEPYKDQSTPFRLGQSRTRRSETVAHVRQKG